MSNQPPQNQDKNKTTFDIRKKVIRDLTKDQSLSALFYWIKNNKISVKEFKELIDLVYLK